MINKEKLDKIDAYFMGNLKENEEQELLDEVSKNDVLKTEFDLRKIEHESIELLIEDDLRNKFDDWEKENVGNNENKPKTISLKRYLLPLSIAASFLLLLGYFVVESNKYTNEVLADRYYQPDFSGLRSIDSGASDVFSNVENIIQNNLTERYPELEKALENIPTQHPNFSIGQYYLGHLYFEQDKFTNAVTAFDNSLVDPTLMDDTEWYKAIALLHDNKHTDAEELLISITNNSEHDHVNKAKKLLEDMSSIWRSFRR